MSNGQSEMKLWTHSDKLQDYKDRNATVKIYFDENDYSCGKIIEFDREAILLETGGSVQTHLIFKTNVTIIMEI